LGGIGSRAEAQALLALMAVPPQAISQLAFARRARDRWAEAHARNMLGQVSRYRGSYRQANARLGRALRSFRAAADPDGAASVLNSLGEVARDAGQPARARSLFQQALRGHQLTGSKRGMAADLEGIAATTALHSASRTTLVYLGAAQNLREITGGPLPPAETAVLDLWVPKCVLNARRG
jgi:tetratricopeptide (TPR) repeat protein